MANTTGSWLAVVTDNATAKTTPASNDAFPFMDSTVPGTLKKLLWSDLVVAITTLIVNGAPGALDTLKELADAMADDANFATTITNALALKAPLASPTLTTPVLNGSVTGTGVSGAATASTLAARDAQANLLADAFIAGFASTATAAGTTTLTVDSVELQAFTGSTTQTCVLPTTGVVAGQRFVILNQSAGAVSVTSSNTNSLGNLNTGQSMTVVALIATPTTSAHWACLISAPSAFRSTAGTSSVVVRDGQGAILTNAFIPSLTSTATAAGTTTLTVGSAQKQVFTGSTTQTVALPTTSIAAGQTYEILNTSSGALTVNSSGGNLVKTVAGGASTTVTALQATPTTAAHWYAT